MTTRKVRLPYLRRSPRPRVYWRATLRSASPLGFILFGEWHQRIKIFRWKWVASIVARWHRLPLGRHTLKEAVVEPYSVGANVISLGLARSRMSKET